MGRPSREMVRGFRVRWEHPEVSNILETRILLVSERRRQEIVCVRAAAARLEERLRCPVCLETAGRPIYTCDEDHLVCGDCTPKMTECPMCREEFTLATSKRFRGAERQAERLVALKKQLQCRPLE